MAEQVKVGIVGTSWWTDLIFLPVLTSCERARVTAICGRRREPADQLAAKYTIPQVFTEYRQLIDQGDLDAVVIATPDHLHYPIGMAVLDAGLHLLCEKPTALNARDAKAMYDKAQAEGVKHMVMYTWHWLPPVQRFKQLVDEGSIGRIYHGSFQWLSNFWRSRDYLWRIDAESANGEVGDLGSHMMHLALWTMGEVSAVTARLGFHVQRDGLDGKPLRMANDSALVTLDFASGAQAQIAVSGVAYLTEPMNPTCVLYGEKGTLKAGWILGDDLISDTAYVHAKLDGAVGNISDELALNLVDYFKTHSVGPRQFIDAILDDQPIYPGLYEGYKVQQVIDAALQSHETGCRVTIAP